MSGYGAGGRAFQMEVAHSRVCSTWVSGIFIEWQDWIEFQLCNLSKKASKGGILGSELAY